MKKDLIEMKDEFLAIIKIYVEIANEFKYDVNKITMESISSGEMVVDTDLQISYIESIIDKLLLSKCNNEVKEGILTLLYCVIESVNNGASLKMLKERGEYDVLVQATAQEKIDRWNK